MVFAELVQCQFVSRLQGTENKRVLKPRCQHQSMYRTSLHSSHNFCQRIIRISFISLVFFACNFLNIQLLEASGFVTLHFEAVLCLRRLDNCRLAAIHPFTPLVMRGAAPASSKQQMARQWRFAARVAVWRVLSCAIFTSQCRCTFSQLFDVYCITALYH